MPDQPVTPLVLAVDTTHEWGSLALARGQTCLDQVSLHEPAGFAHILYQHLQDLLDRQGVALPQIDCFAAASGPGSFTGVRIGLACVKGLAEALGKPSMAVSNLRALATFGRCAQRATVLDARRGAVYGAVYDAAGSAVAPEVVAPWEVWLEGLPEGPLEFLAMDYVPVLAGTRFADARVSRVEAALAPAIARLAAAGFERGQAGDPAALDANYVRRSDAELFWKE